MFETTFQSFFINNKKVIIQMNSQELRNLQEAYMEVYDQGYKSFPYDKVKAKAKKLKTDRESLGKKPLTGKSDSEIGDTLNKMEKLRNRETRLGLQSNIAHSFVPKQKEKSNRNRPESEKRSKTVEPQKSFGNRLTRSDKQGIKDSYDLYDIILSHLLDEGYAETQEQAEVIMVNMSEDWRESICEGLKPRPEEKMQNKIKKNSQRWMKMHDIELGMPHARRLVDRNDKIRNNLFTPNSDRDAVYNKHRPEEGKRSKFISDNNAKKK